MVIIRTKNNQKQTLPTNDYVFKSIFGNVGNEKITEDLISNILNEDITSINLDENTFLIKDLSSDKVGILDVKVTLNSDIICDIEVQVQNQENFEERMLYYWSKLYSKTLNKFEEDDENNTNSLNNQNGKFSTDENEETEKNIYKYLKKTISIQFLDFEPENLKSLHKFHSKWKIIETECSNIVLTDHLEFHIISLEKLRKMLQKDSSSIKNSGLVDWGKFLINPYNLDESILERNEAIKMAKQKLDEFNSKQYEVRIAELRHKAILDRNNMEYTGYVRGEKIGFKKGEKIGIKKGKNEGKLEEKTDIAKKMLAKNYSIEEIIDLTGLTQEEIEKLL